MWLDAVATSDSSGFSFGMRGLSGTWKVRATIFIDEVCGVPDA